MGYLSTFDKSINAEESSKKEFMPICDFSIQWCDIYPTPAQRVILKLYAGEKLSNIPATDDKGRPHIMSEQEWFDEMYDRGYLPPGIKDDVANGLEFQDILLVIGRRGGKSTVIAVAALYTVYKVLQHDNPQSYFDIQQGSDIEISVAAKTGKQAARAPYAKIRNICEHAIAHDTPLAEWIEDIQKSTLIFLTKEDRKRKKRLEERNIRRYQNHGTIKIEAYNSNTDSFRGGAVIAAIMDEFAQYDIHKQTGEDAAEYFYDTLVPAVHQFKEDGRVFILSTPQGKVGKFYKLYLDVFEGEDEDIRTVGMKMPSWESWEGMPDDYRGKVTLQSLADDPRVKFKWDYRGRYTEDGLPEPLDQAYAKAPASFKREFGAEFEGAEDQWIPEILIYNPHDPQNSFRRTDMTQKYQGEMGRVYVAHGDPSRNHDGFGLAVGHKEMHPRRGEEVIIDYAHRWIVQPHEKYRSPGPQFETVISSSGAEPAHVKFREIREHIQSQLLHRFGIRLFTFDQWNSQLIIEDLAYYIFEKDINTSIDLLNFNPQVNKEKDDHFQQLILEHRIHSYHNPVLERELTNLYKDKFGRVQALPGEHDDLYDCISVVALNAMEMPELQDTDTQNNPFNVDPVFVEQRM